MAAVFLVLQVLGVPGFSIPKEPQLSSPHNAKPSTSAVVKPLLRSHPFKVTKSSSFFAFFGCQHQFKNPDVHISVSQQKSKSFASVSVSTILARAPPA
jgi:hypothetical protein